MARISLAFLLTLACLIHFGCGPKDPDVESASRSPMITAGTWTGEFDGASVTLSLADDGRFQTVFRGGKYRSVVKGKAELVGTDLVLMPSEFDGVPPATKSQQEPAKFTVGDSWNLLTSEDGMELKRKI